MYCCILLCAFYWDFYATNVSGDNRLDTMETGSALVRAMIHVMKSHPSNKMHVINMSYGELSNFSTSGFVKILLFFNKS